MHLIHVHLSYSIQFIASSLSTLYGEGIATCRVVILRETQLLIPTFYRQALKFSIHVHIDKNKVMFGSPLKTLKAITICENCVEALSSKL